MQFIDKRQDNCSFSFNCPFSVLGVSALVTSKSDNYVFVWLVLAVFIFKLLYIVFSMFSVSIRCDHYCWLAPRRLTWFQQSLTVSWLSEPKKHFKLMLQVPPLPLPGTSNSSRSPGFFQWDMICTSQSRCLGCPLLLGQS